MNDNSLIEQTVAFVKETLEGAEAGHDWFHIERVWKLSKHIHELEADGDRLVIELGALLHDIADAKFHDGDEEVGPRVARVFLESQGVSDEIITKIDYIIRHISFKSNIGTELTPPLELAIVQDADRLDAIGAIGIARALHYGGFKNRKIHDPSIAPNMTMTKEEYKTNPGTTINHFYEKLLLLKDKMNTRGGKQLAEARHAFMEQYLDEFLAEWQGER